MVNHKMPDSAKARTTDYLHLSVGLVSCVMLGWLLFVLPPIIKAMVHVGAPLALWVTELPLMVGGPLGWGSLAFACWFQAQRFPRRKLAVVLAIGTAGTAVSLASVYTANNLLHPVSYAKLLIALSGLSMFNSLALIWGYDRFRGVLRASNRT